MITSACQLFMRGLIAETVGIGDVFPGCSMSVQVKKVQAHLFVTSASWIAGVYQWTIEVRPGWAARLATPSPWSCACSSSRTGASASTWRWVACSGGALAAQTPLPRAHHPLRLPCPDPPIAPLPSPEWVSPIGRAYWFNQIHLLDDCLLCAC